uniref:Uncharacterized protein n=1 Tax=Cacopsylla melanoneura TaxID=428564 RepID=A0A8D9BTL3_9HEMI
MRTCDEKSCRSVIQVGWESSRDRTFFAPKLMHCNFFFFWQSCESCDEHLPDTVYHFFCSCQHFSNVRQACFGKTMITYTPRFCKYPVPPYCRTLGKINQVLLYC